MTPKDRLPATVRRMPEVTRRRVLIVDDDASVRESLSKVLRDAGYETLLASDGQEAIDRYDAKQVDILLLDIGLPVRNGWETFERFTGMNPTLPIVIITGQTGQYSLARMAGVGALMEKPLGAPQLLEIIKKLLAEPEEAKLRRLCGYDASVKYVPPDIFPLPPDTGHRRS
jgi:CheY-like chemotaxis protein